jgi:hypothetical protein
MTQTAPKKDDRRAKNQENKKNEKIQDRLNGWISSNTIAAAMIFGTMGSLVFIAPNISFKVPHFQNPAAIGVGVIISFVIAFLGTMTQMQGNSTPTDLTPDLT